MIQTEEEYQLMLAEAEKLMGSDPERESAEGVRLLALVDELEAYEKLHYPMEYLQGGTPEGT